MVKNKWRVQVQGPSQQCLKWNSTGPRGKPTEAPLLWIVTRIWIMSKGKRKSESRLSACRWCKLSSPGGEGGVTDEVLLFLFYFLMNEKITSCLFRPHFVLRWEPTVTILHLRRPIYLCTLQQPCEAGRQVKIFMSITQMMNWASAKAEG